MSGHFPDGPLLAKEGELRIKRKMLDPWLKGSGEHKEKATRAFPESVCQGQRVCLLAGWACAVARGRGGGGQQIPLVSRLVTKPTYSRAVEEDGGGGGRNM